MKTSKLFALVAGIATAAAFTACSSDEIELQNGSSKADVITLTSRLNMTRATSDPQATQLNTAVTVGAFGVSGDATITNGDNNQYTVEANGDLSATTEMTWPQEGDVSIFAYAPYQEGWTYNAANTFSVAADQTTEAGYLASDLVYGTPAQNPVAQTESAIALNFTHKLAKINVTIQKVEGSEIDLTSGSVTITNTKIATTLNPSTGEIGEATGSAADIKAVAALGDATTACAIIVPQTVEAGTQLVKIIADGKQLNAKLGTATTFVGGKSYNFTVKVGKVEEPVVEVTLELGSTSIVDWDSEDLGEAESEEAEIEPITLTATFQTPGSNASYNAPTYTWTGSTSNLMTVFEFANGELADYHTLQFTFSNLVDGPVRMGYYVGSTFTEFGNGYYSAGEKTIDLTALGIDLSTVTKIAFGGKSSAGSCDILATDVILIGNGDGTTDVPGDASPGTTDDKLYATFGTPGSNASYDATTFTYAWTGSTNNLMNCFTFDNGELADYTTLNFTFSELSDGASVRINVLFSDNTNKSKSYYSAGTKATAITELLDDTHTAADVTALRFGGNSGSGSAVLKAAEMYLE